MKIEKRTDERDIEIDALFHAHMFKECDSKRSRGHGAEDDIVLSDKDFIYLRWNELLRYNHYNKPLYRGVEISIKNKP